MIDLGWSAADRRDLYNALINPNRVRTLVEVQNLDGDHLADLSARVLDGQVDGSNGVRQLSVTLKDPKRRLPFDSDDPSDTALFMDRVLHVAYRVLVNGDWKRIPVFTGPVTGLTRSNGEVSVTGSDKSILYGGAAWQPMTLHKGMKRTDALRRIVKEANPVYAEADRFLFLPDLPGRLPHHVSLTRESVPWHEAQQMAAASDRQLFYNGRGELHARRIASSRSVFTFHGDKHVVTPVQIAYSPGTVNAARVIGAVPKGANHHVHGVYVAPFDHPLSPHRIGRYLMPDGHIVRDDKIKTTAEANARAKRLVEDGLREGVDVSFESVPVPMLDLGDIVHVRTDDASVTFRLKTFTLPLVVGDGSTMSIGTHKNVRRLSPHHAHRARRHHPHKRRRAA